MHILLNFAHEVDFVITDIHFGREEPEEHVEADVKGQINRKLGHYYVDVLRTTIEIHERFVA